jgi:hypothetical protein
MEQSLVAGKLGRIEGRALLLREAAADAKNTIRGFPVCRSA